jgi:predicted Zn-dependent protease
VSVLERGLETTLDATRRIELLERLGDVYRERTSAPEKALACYRQVLAEAPDHAGGREGMTALLGDARCRPAAVPLLLAAFDATGDWAGRLSLLEHRLELSATDAARTELLREAADLHEQKREDAAAALAALARALPLAPEDTGIEERMIALAEATGDHATLARALGEAVEAGPEDERAADLHERRGGLLEEHLGDAEGALEAYLASFALAPERPQTAAAIVRVATALGRWDTAATAIVTSARATESLERALLGAFEGAAAKAGAWDAAAGALAAAVAADAALSPVLAGVFERRAAVWHRDHRGDAAAAELALERALGRAGDEVATLSLLADVQRRAPGPKLVTTLLRLAEAGHEPLAALREAGVTALEVLGDDAQAATIFDRLLRELADRLERDAVSLDLFAESVVTGPEEEDLAQQATFTVDKLVGLAKASGDHARAVEILDRAARLPLGEGAAIERLHQAAAIAEEHMADTGRAIALLRTILKQAPADAPAIARLGALFARTERTADLLALRRHELALAARAEDHLRLRLDIAELLGRLGEDEAQLQALRDNLAEEPAHEPSLEEIARLLAEQGAFADLCGTLEHEAEALAERGDGARAAGLFTRASDLAEEKLGDTARALAARTRSAELAPTPETFDALARLSTASGDHGAAVAWIERRLSALPADAKEDRIATVARLASAHHAAGRDDAARAALERGLSDHPESETLREPLRALYRSAGAWDGLVELLTRPGAEPAKVEHLREAADICLKKLGSRERAIPILEALTAQAPNDRAARIALADALRATGQLEPARAILAKLLDEYGRRKPPERAEVHTQLARIAQAAGDLDEARRQLETASAMNPEHPGALRLLGAMYRDAGELERAERMFGALLLIAMRNPAAGEATPEGPARSEAMIHLYEVLARLGQKPRAQEMLASAFEAAKTSDHEARRLEEALRGASDPVLLLRALELRLGRGDLEGAARAAVLAEMAEVLGGPLERHDEALTALLGALEHDPSSSQLLARSVAAARSAGNAAVLRCAETLERLAGSGRGASASALCFTLGDLCERDLSDPARALAAFVRAEALAADAPPPSTAWGSTPPPSTSPAASVAVWRAIDRTAAAAGDPAAQIRALRQLAFAGDAGDPAALTEDIYRLAGLELSSPADVAAGLATLDWAMSREIRHEQAGALLRRAAELAPGDAAVLAAYERVARAAESPTMLLDALDRASAAPGATMDTVREAVELATAAKDTAHVEALLGRAVTLGDESPNGLGEAVWALIALADLREAAGDFTAAVGHLSRAVEAAERDDAIRHATRAAELAEHRVGDVGLAASVYERLIERDRHDRDVWVPLLDLHRRGGDRDRLEQKLRDAIECAFDVTWRIQLRRERAALLLDTRWEDAAAELAELLNEDEDDTQAALQLTALYERHGRHEALADLLERRLSGARMRGDVAQGMALSLQLGALVAPTTPDRAIEVYRGALESSPESQPLLTRLLALYSDGEHEDDRAEILERLLATSTGDDAVERALSLAALRDKMGDDEGALRALRLGFQASPGNVAVRDRLAEFYKSRETWSELAEMLATEGKAAEGAASVARLREAAALYLDKLDRPADAADALLLASSRAPDDLSLLVELARCLARAGREAEARERVGEALARGAGATADRVALLRLRAELTTEADQLADAIEDLEAAYRLDPAVAPDLAEYLERHRAAPAGSGDRALWLRLFDLHLTMGKNDTARDLLGEWLSQEPGDIGVLRKAAFMDALSGRWDQAVELCDRIVGLEEGPARVAAALLVAAACVQAGYPADARPVLETVFRDNPADPTIREHLRRIYEETGAHRELADLATVEAEQTVDPGDRFAALRRAGQLWIESVGDFEAAVAPLRAASELKPRDGDVAVMLADAYIGANRLQEAANFLDAALQAQKGRRSREVSLMQQRMAMIAGSVGDRANEAGWLNAALDSDAQNSEAAARLADVATEMGQFDVAIKALKAIAMMKSPKPITRAMAYVRQALIAQHQGDVRKAVLLARKAQSEDPSLEEANSLLAELSG